MDDIVIYFYFSGLLPGEGGEYVPQGNMTTIEVEAVMREKVRGKYDNLKQAFQTYDVDQNETVTKGEFRRVLESYCLPLTSDQFEAIMNKVSFLFVLKRPVLNKCIFKKIVKGFFYLLENGLKMPKSDENLNTVSKY